MLKGYIIRTITTRVPTIAITLILILITIVIINDGRFRLIEDGSSVLTITTVIITFIEFIILTFNLITGKVKASELMSKAYQWLVVTNKTDTSTWLDETPNYLKIIVAIIILDRLIFIVRTF